ncbi:MAG TPA: hypothetical protein VGE40_06230 [Bacilli bacterium]
MDMILVESKELVAIGYSEEEQAIYVKDNHNVTRVYENKPKELFDYFMNSKQKDYFYSVCFKKIMN